jgi:hypothetical protein
MSTVNPDRILRELADLWVTAAKPAEGQSSQQESGGVLRACAMTLVAFVDEEENAQDLGETIAMLMRGHPSRAVVIRICEGEDRLESRVFQQCWMPFGQRRQICCEQVEITASQDHLCDVPSIVAPLAVPDLPSVVWLRSRRICDAGAYGDVLQLGEKVIVDSARDGAPSFKTLIAFLDRGSIVGDLAWTRITELRQLVAQLVGSRSPRKFTVRGAGIPEPGIEARYLFAWLANAFPNAASLLSSTGPGAENNAGIEIDDDIRITLHPGSADYQVSSMRQTAKFKSGSDFDLLNEELGITVHDPIFEKVLRKVAEWQK